MFTKKFNNLSDSLIDAAAKTLTKPVVNEASNEKPTINHLELSEEELNEMGREKVASYMRGRVATAARRGGATPSQEASLQTASKKLNSPQSVKVPATSQQQKAKGPSSVNPDDSVEAKVSRELERRGIEAEETELKGNQHRLDVAPPYGKLTADDFKKLRNEQPQLSAQDREELRRGRDPFRGDTTTGLRPSRPATSVAPKPTTAAPMPPPPAPPVAPMPAPPAPPVKKDISESMRSHLRELLKINEAKRGRKPKDGGDDEEGPHYDEREDPETGEITRVKDTVPPKKHIMNQLRQAAQSMKAQHPVTYADGSTHNVPKHVAKDLVNAYQDPAKKPYEREAMQTKIGQSHKALMQHHSTMSEESFDPNLKNGKKMLLEPGKAKKEKKELDENPVETVKQIKMYQQDEEQVTHDAPFAKRVVVPEESEEEPPFEPDPKRKKRPDEPKTARGLARAAMRQAIERAKTKAKMNEEQIDERHMSDAEMKKREDIVMGMKKEGGVAGFKKRYGDRWREVMYATATKQAMKTEETPKGDGVKIEPEMPFRGSGGVQSTKV